MNNKTIVVTGGSGFVAGWVIRDLLQHDYTVRASLRNMRKADRVTGSVTRGLPAEQAARLSFFTADLTSTDGWAAGMHGADAIMHVASPLGHGTESTEEMVRVARGGTLNVLQAAHDAGVTRVVMTSSQAASTAPTSVGDQLLDEEYWSPEDNPELDPYRRSKIAAEKAAWQFAREQGMELTTIMPGAIFGPILTPDQISSDSILLTMLRGQHLVPKVPMEITDVRDLATLHRLALSNPAAVGHRYLAADQLMTMPSVLATYRQAFPELHLHFVAAPNWTVRLMSRFVPSLRTLVPMLRRRYRHTTAAAQRDLGWTQHTPAETVLDAARSLMDAGLVK